MTEYHKKSEERKERQSNADSYSQTWIGKENRLRQTIRRRQRGIWRDSGTDRQTGRQAEKHNVRETE